MASHKFAPWTNEEVKTFLAFVSEERFQAELDGSTRKERVFQALAEKMAAHGYSRTSKQCREKLKKMKSKYRDIKDHNGRSGNDRESGVDTALSILPTMDAESPCTNQTVPASPISERPGPSETPTPASSPMEPSSPVSRSAGNSDCRTFASSSQTRVTGKRKRSTMSDGVRCREDLMRLLHDMQEAGLLGEDAELRRREMQQFAAFNNGLLNHY